MKVSGTTTLHREQVFGACALLDGRPARVEVSAVRDGRQTVTIRRRRSTPLVVVVKTANKATPTGWLHAIPPYDWPDTEARTVPLAFSGRTAQAPERVPAAKDDLGVWSVVSVKVGKLVAAQLVAPNQHRVELSPAAAATLRVRVLSDKSPQPLERAWFEDALPDQKKTCTPHESWGRWGAITLDGTTTATLEVPPSGRRCVFVRTATGEVVGTPAPMGPGTSVRTLRLAAQEHQAKVIKALAWVPGGPMGVTCRPDTFWALYDSLVHITAVAKRMGEREGLAALNPDGDTPVNSFITLSAFAQAWLPFLAPPEAEELMTRTVVVPCSHCSANVLMPAEHTLFQCPSAAPSCAP